MGHFVDLNCARRAYCVVVNEKRAVCTVSANFQNIWKKRFLGGRLETEIVYFVNVIDAKLQKAATILLARQPGLGLAKSKQSPKISQLEEEQLEESLLARLRRSWQAGVSSHIPIALQLMLVRPALAWPDRAPAYI